MITNYNRAGLIPHEWQARIRRLPTIQSRAMLAVFLISAYRRRRELYLATPEWKKDLDLGHLAYWPKCNKKQLLSLHMHFLQTDVNYGRIAKGLKPIVHTFCLTPISNTPLSAIGVQP